MHRISGRPPPNAPVRSGLPGPPGRHIANKTVSLRKPPDWPGRRHVGRWAERPGSRQVRRRECAPPVASGPCGHYVRMCAYRLPNRVVTPRSADRKPLFETQLRFREPRPYPEVPEPALRASPTEGHLCRRSKNRLAGRDLRARCCRWSRLLSPGTSVPVVSVGHRAGTTNGRRLGSRCRRSGSARAFRLRNAPDRRCPWGSRSRMAHR